MPPPERCAARRPRFWIFLWCGRRAAPAPPSPPPPERSGSARPAPRMELSGGGPRGFGGGSSGSARGLLDSSGGAPSTGPRVSLRSSARRAGLWRAPFVAPRARARPPPLPRLSPSRVRGGGRGGWAGRGRAHRSAPPGPAAPALFRPPARAPPINTPGRSPRPREYGGGAASVRARGAAPALRPRIQRGGSGPPPNSAPLPRGGKGWRGG